MLDFGSFLLWIMHAFKWTAKLNKCIPGVGYFDATNIDRCLQIYTDGEWYENISKTKNYLLSMCILNFGMAKRARDRWSVRNRISPVARAFCMQCAWIMRTKYSNVTDPSYVSTDHCLFCRWWAGCHVLPTFIVLKWHGRKLFASVRVVYALAKYVIFPLAIWILCKIFYRKLPQPDVRAGTKYCKHKPEVREREIKDCLALIRPLAAPTRILIVRNTMDEIRVCSSTLLVQCGLI